MHAHAPGTDTRILRIVNSQTNFNDSIIPTHDITRSTREYARVGVRNYF